MMRQKWKSRRGETLVEALISLLVASLALTMLAGMMFKSTKLLENSRGIMETYAGKTSLLNNPVSATSGDLTDLQLKTNEDPDSPETATATITFTSPASGVISVPVTYILDDERAENPTVSYVTSGG